MITFFPDKLRDHLKGHYFKLSQMQIQEFKNIWNLCSPVSALQEMRSLDLWHFKLDSYEVSHAALHQPTRLATRKVSPGPPGRPPSETVGAPPSKSNFTSAVCPLFVMFVTRGCKWASERYRVNHSGCSLGFVDIKTWLAFQYRVIHQVVANLPLTSKHQF